MEPSEENSSPSGSGTESSTGDTALETQSKHDNKETESGSQNTDESYRPRMVMSISSGSRAPEGTLKDQANPSRSEESKVAINVNIGEKRKTEGESTVPKKIMSLQHGTKAPSKPLITMKLGSKSEKEKTEAPTMQQKKGSVAKAFAEDSDSEEEEMPKEAKMRMRNLGRETPTSAGPNSFNKGKLGFVNRNKMFEMSLKNKIDAEKPL